MTLSPHRSVLFAVLFAGSLLCVGCEQHPLYTYTYRAQSDRASQAALSGVGNEGFRPTGEATNADHIPGDETPTAPQFLRSQYERYNTQRGRVVRHERGLISVDELRSRLRPDDVP